MAAAQPAEHGNSESAGRRPEPRPGSGGLCWREGEGGSIDDSRSGRSLDAGWRKDDDDLDVAGRQNLQLHKLLLSELLRVHRRDLGQE